MKKILPLAVLLVTLAACGGSGSKEAVVKKTSTTSTTTTSTTTTTLPPTTTTTLPPPEYPKEVPMAGIDYRFAGFLGGDQGKTTAVLLAPGVYAERGAGALGTADDYTSYVGLCSDVNQYSDLHPGGNVCW